jgi:plastocyanin
MWRRLLGPLVSAAIVAAGCGAATDADAPPPSAPAGGVVIVARNLAFDRTELEITADRRFQLLFENREGQPHNVTILDGEAGEPLFVGEVFGGPTSRAYDVPAIPEGSHRFRCDVHQDMSGTVLARSE